MANPLGDITEYQRREIRRKEIIEAKSNTNKAVTIAGSIVKGIKRTASDVKGAYDKFDQWNIKQEEAGIEARKRRLEKLQLRERELAITNRIANRQAKLEKVRPTGFGGMAGGMYLNSITGMGYGTKPAVKRVKHQKSHTKGKSITINLG